jgi:alpha-tubulin suppressor-like RCC1 family protein
VLLLALLAGFGLVSPRTASATGTATAIAASGYAHTCAVVDGAVKCWGGNFYGQLGDASTTNRLTPVSVSGISSGATALAAGDNHTCAIVSGGVKCWGRNNNGQLGIGSTTDHNTPQDVTGLTSGVIGIAAGEDHTCALTSSGGVKCWGLGGSGQIGDGSYFNRTTPSEAFPTGTGITAIAAGGYVSCAITSSGGMKCWGYGWHGQIGDGMRSNRAYPTDVYGLTSGVTAIGVGYSHTCAVVSGGAKCWGDNGSGKLGDNSTTRRTTPVDVSGLSSGVSSIDGGAAHTCARMTSGAVKCWGANGDGQLGLGNTYGTQWTPVEVTALGTDPSALAVGGSHNCALMYGGLKCWGQNPYGGLGDNSTTKRYTPVNVSGLEVPPPPTGAIVSPRAADTFGQATVNFEATASTNSGPAIDEVRFYVKYDGSWHNIGADTTATTVSGQDYYSVAWATPKTLATQTITFSVHIENTAGRIAVDAGGVKEVNYVATVLNPNINSAWEPSGAYLNQVELQPGGDPVYWGTQYAPRYNMCNGSSAAMMLGLTGYITPTLLGMEDLATDVFTATYDSFATENIADFLNGYFDSIGALATVTAIEPIEYGGTTDDAWNEVTGAIDNGYPVMIGTKLTGEGGHYVVVVGYNENGGGKQIIAYDPYGYSQAQNGTYGTGVNGESAGQVKGRWVYYDFTDTDVFDPSDRWLLIFNLA